MSLYGSKEKESKRTVYSKFDFERFESTCTLGLCLTHTSRSKYRSSGELRRLQRSFYHNTTTRHALNTFILDPNSRPSPKHSTMDMLMRVTETFKSLRVTINNAYLAFSQIFFLSARKRDYLVYDHLPSSSTINVSQGQQT